MIKHILTLFFILSLSMLSLSQNEANDIIYPLDGGSPLAMSTTNNASDRMYDAYGYKHYANLQKKAKSQKGWGAVLTIGGVSVFFIGAGMLVDANYFEKTGEYERENLAAAGRIFETIGLISTVIGIPVWVTGGLNYRNATEGVERTKNSEVSFNIVTTQNGIGLMMKF